MHISSLRYFVRSYDTTHSKLSVLLAIRQRPLESKQDRFSLVSYRLLQSDWVELTFTVINSFALPLRHNCQSVKSHITCSFRGLQSPQAVEPYNRTLNHVGFYLHTNDSAARLRSAESPALPSLKNAQRPRRHSNRGYLGRRLQG